MPQSRSAVGRAIGGNQQVFNRSSVRNPISRASRDANIISSNLGRTRSSITSTRRGGSFVGGRSGSGVVVIDPQRRGGSNAGRSRSAFRQPGIGSSSATARRRSFGRGNSFARGIGRGGNRLPISNSLGIGSGTANGFRGPSGNVNRTGLRLLEHDPGRIEWLSRNNYPPRAFGVGYGFNNDYGYLGTGRRGRGHHGRDFHHSRNGLYVGIGINRGSYGRHDSCFDRRFYFGTSLGRSYFDPFGYSVPYYYPSYYSSGVYPSYSSTTYIQNYGVDPYGYDADDAVSYGELNDDAYVTGDGVTVSPVEPQQAQDVVTAAPATPEQAVDLGLAAFSQGQFESARRELVSALLAAPKEPELIMLYAYAHFATGDYLISALSMKQAMELDNSLIAKPIDLYSLYGDPSQFEAHLAQLDEFIESHPDDADARFVAGYVRYAAGDPVSAKVYFDSVGGDAAGAINQQMVEAASRAIEATNPQATGGDTVQPGDPTDDVIISEPTP